MTSDSPRSRQRIVMVLENSDYPADVRVRQEAEALVRGGHKVTVLAPRVAGERRRERVDGVDVWRFRLPQSSERVAGFLLEYAVAHVQLLLRCCAQLARGATVVHLHNPPDTLFVIGLLARALGRPVVFDQHDSTPELFEAKFGTSRATRILRAAQRASLAHASAVIVTNESQRRLALERSPRLRTVAIVRNGPRAERVVERGPPRPGALTDPRLVYVGELSPQDGVLALSDLLAAPELAGATLTVVGDGPSRGPLEERCSALGVRERLRVTGWVDHQEVFAILAQADIAVDPAPCNSYNHISTAMKIAEYLAAGLPVVAYRLRETEWTAGPAAVYGECGDAADLAAQVARVARDGALRGALSDAALVRVRDLVWERSEETLLALYDSFR